MKIKPLAALFCLFLSAYAGSPEPSRADPPMRPAAPYDENSSAEAPRDEDTTRAAKRGGDARGPAHREPWIEYPQPAERVRHASIPIWIRSDNGRDLDELVVHLNGSDVSDQFGPWGGRRMPGRSDSSADSRRLPAEAIATIRPRPGANRVEIWTGGATGEPTAAADFELEPYAVSLRVSALEGGREVPARISFHGLDGTPDPALAPPIWNRIAPEAFEGRRNFIYTAGPAEVVFLGKGRYEILASRGPAYSMARAVVEPRRPLGEAPVDVALEIRRVVDTRGWVSADFHVHAIASADSSIPFRDRLASFRAQDVDAIVTSDHWVISDYEEDLGANAPELQGIEAIPGVETGTYKTKTAQPEGHWNFWPLERDHEHDVRTALDAPTYGGRKPADLRSVSELYAHFEAFNADARRARFGDFRIVTQLNHPRGFQKRPFGAVQHAHDYLESMKYDPSRPLDEEPNAQLLRRPAPELPRPIDVDAIELLNRLAYPLYLEVRRDWFAWISQGFAPTATANTDSHWIVIVEAGYPRNWVRYDGPLPVEPERLAAALRARQVVGSTGPLIEISPWTRNGRPWIGALDAIEVSVRGPAWMPIEEVRVWVDGELAATRKLPPQPEDSYSTQPQVHRLEIPLALEKDAFIVVEAGDRVERMLSAEPHDDPLGRAFPDLRVIAFTNPLLVDFEGDGTIWDRASAPTAGTAD